MASDNRIHSPANIEFLLWCHTHVTPFPQIEMPMYAELASSFLELGVIKTEGLNVFETTELGKAWVEALCKVEMPRTAYVDQHGTILKMKED